MIFKKDNTFVIVTSPLKISKNDELIDPNDTREDMFNEILLHISTFSRNRTNYVSTYFW